MKAQEVNRRCHAYQTLQQMQEDENFGVYVNLELYGSSMKQSHYP